MNENEAAVTDRSGKVIFSHGAAGAAHVIAHRALDEGRLEDGYRDLGAYLDTHDGEGSDWVHVHWHMAVFELALGHWDAAHRRYLRRIAPAVSEAATDAPALLWRLTLAADADVELPWSDVAALGAAEDASPFVKLHHLLALAGAGDTAVLRGRLGRPATSIEDRLVDSYGRGLLAYASGDYARAIADFDEALPHIHRLGGSHAQNQLFVQIRDRAANFVDQALRTAA